MNFNKTLWVSFASLLKTKLFQIYYNSKQICCKNIVKFYCIHRLYENSLKINILSNEKYAQSPWQSVTLLAYYQFIWGYRFLKKKKLQKFEVTINYCLRYVGGELHTSTCLDLISWLKNFGHPLSFFFLKNLRTKIMWQVATTILFLLNNHHSIF